MKRNFIVSSLAFIVILSSCKKDNTNTGTIAIQGTYEFKYLTAKTTSTLTGSDGEKIVTTSDYTTINNGGTIVIGGSNLSATALTYEVNDVAIAAIYQDNELINSVELPFKATFPLNNAVQSYNLIGADSIYFPHGVLTPVIEGTGSVQYGASGGRYVLNGKMLTITQNASKDSSFSDSGVTFILKESGVATIVMEKQ